MKHLILAAILSAAALPALAQNADGLPQETVDAITAKLAEMNCQMDPDDIEAEDEGYDLDDVICEGGQQYDILLDMDLNEVSRRAE
ncbi:PepSY domain-containing protein [Mangrovicoccus algicola]|uniref:PepSY domain-containing protein n=1 Tax=Mangrovicoccus algicola TaxID=2771008 RepID=A0A8J6Z5Y0_9RHOB|nr:PepSY domain-containing protein [Mangrovicoccus algicola]MBE3637001.1 PepSY domain-containing protein [Mangrovicoccus algicola]